MNKEALEQCLREFPTAVEVDVEGDYRFMVRIVAKRWDGVDDGLRQRDILGYLSKRFSDKELDKIEYVNAEAPGDED